MKLLHHYDKELDDYSYQKKVVIMAENIRTGTIEQVSSVVSEREAMAYIHNETMLHAQDRGKYAVYRNYKVEIVTE